MRLTWGGVLVYAGTALTLVVQAVRLVMMDGIWGDGIAFAPAGLVAVAAASALLFGVGAVIRRPLIADDGPWISTMGWAVLIALGAVCFVLSMLSTSPASEGAIWVTVPAVFVPFWVRKLEESYREGVEEGRRER
jgi:hypothetical protein